MNRLVRCAIAIAICASLCAVYWGLSTQWCVRADGGTRSLGIYVSERPFLHANNHLLYPIAYYLWKRLAIAGGSLPQT